MDSGAVERQEVNLYALEFRQKDQPLSAKRIAQCAAATFVLLILVEVITLWRFYANREQLVSLQQQQQVIAQRLQTLKQNRPLSRRNELEVQIRGLRDQVRRREELRSIISGQDLGNAEGFSKYLDAMARQALPDIALSKFRLLQGGGYVEFEGETRRADAVPLYLQQLRAETSFERVRFGTLSISREQPARAGELRFSVAQVPDSSS